MRLHIENNIGAERCQVNVRFNSCYVTLTDGKMEFSKQCNVLFKRKETLMYTTIKLKVFLPPACLDCLALICIYTSNHRRTLNGFTSAVLSVLVEY